MDGILEVKNINAQGNIKDVDRKTRTISGYFSVFGNVDLDNDIIEKGAWSNSINERANDVRYLYNHNWEKPLDKGSVNLKLQEDNYGLKFDAKIPEGLSYGDDLIILYESGIVDEHSVGFETIKSVKGDKGVRILKELKLYEGSAVTMAANPLAKLTSIKSYNRKENNEMICKILKLFKSGNLTDETYADLEIAIKMLQLQAYELGKNTQVKEEPSADTQEKNFEPYLDILKEFKI